MQPLERLTHGVTFRSGIAVGRKGGYPMFFENLPQIWAPRALAILRIVTGFLFLQHGSMKILGFPYDAMQAATPIVSLEGVAGLLELPGGFLILLGLLTRPVAFLLSGEMAVAYFIAHAPRGHVLSPWLNQGELAVLYCFIFLYLVFAGPGAWSVDARAGSTVRERAASRRP